MFAVLAMSLTCITVFLSLVAEGVTTYELASSILGDLILSFLAVGVPVYLRHRKGGFITQRRILRNIAILSVIATTLMMSAIALASIYAPDAVEFDRLSVTELLVIGVSMSAALFATFIVIFYAVLVAVFGIVGVLVALERLLIPRMLVQVARLGRAEKPSLPDRAAKWLFNIPDVLDTRTLGLNPTEPRKRVLLSDLRAPVLWQLSFGFVLGIYVSFNPFLSDRSPAALLAMFSLLATASTLFPFLILPLLLFRRLGAGIAAQTKRFTLYDGIRSRIFRSYFAIGTIVIIVRLSIQEIAVSLEVYAAAFAVFMGAVLASALLSTFVYLNYFENGVAEDVIEELRGTEVQVTA